MAKKKDDEGVAVLTLPNGKKVNVRVLPISEIQPDQENANRGTERGDAAIEESLRELGAGRSIVLDKDGRAVAGNKTHEKAGAIGLDESVIVVETDGENLVAVQRSDFDLTDPTGSARKYALTDNRSGELSLNWDRERVLADHENGLEMSSLWSKGEIERMIADRQAPDDFPSYDPSTIPTEHQCPKCGYKWSGKSEATTAEPDGDGQQQEGEEANA